MLTFQYFYITNLRFQRGACQKVHYFSLNLFYQSGSSSKTIKVDLARKLPKSHCQGESHSHACAFFTQINKTSNNWTTKSKSIDNPSNNNNNQTSVNNPCVEI